MSVCREEEMVEIFLDHIIYLHIVHHVPGRIRVKANWNGARKLAGVKSSELEAVIAAIPGIVEYRINKKALSVIINYDPEIIPFSLWEAAGRLNHDPRGREAVRGQLLAIVNGRDL